MILSITIFINLVLTIIPMIFLIKLGMIYDLISMIIVYLISLIFVYNYEQPCRNKIELWCFRFILSCFISTEFWLIVAFLKLIFKGE